MLIAHAVMTANGPGVHPSPQQVPQGRTQVWMAEAPPVDFAVASSLDGTRIASGTYDAVWPVCLGRARFSGCRARSTPFTAAAPGLEVAGIIHKAMFERPLICEIECRPNALGGQ
jgi:hypothetical protein